MSLYSYVSGSDDPVGKTESNKSPAPESTASQSGSSGIHDTHSAEIHSIISEELEFRRSKSPGDLSTTKSQSLRGTHSADMLGSDLRSQASAGYIGSPISQCRSRSIPPSRQSSRRPANEMTDFEREFFSEDYMSGDEEDDENLISSLAQNDSFMPDYLGSEKYKDFLRCLPVHLSKRILGMLDKSSLTNCLCLSKHWRVLAEEVKQDYMVHQLMTEEIMLMQVSFNNCLMVLQFYLKSVKPWSQGWLIAAGAYPGFCCMKRLELFLLPLDGLLVHRKSLPRNFVRFPQQLSRTQNNVPGQGSNPDRSLRSRAR